MLIHAKYGYACHLILILPFTSHQGGTSAHLCTAASLHLTPLHTSTFRSVPLYVPLYPCPFHFCTLAFLFAQMHIVSFRTLYTAYLGKINKIVYYFLYFSIQYIFVFLWTSQCFLNALDQRIVFFFK
jgi:hypothetical protein